MRTLLLGVAVAACSRAQPATTTVPGSVLDGKGDNDPNPPASVNTAAQPAAQPGGSTLGGQRLSPADACARFAALKTDGCEWATRFPPEMGSLDVCLATLESWFSPSTQGRETIEKTVACWSLDCGAAATCMMRAQASAGPTAPRECGEEGATPVLVDKATFAKRRGVDVTKLADITTTEQQPVEVCGIDGEVEWMIRATCKDGSRPYADAETVNRGRDSYAARGGRCNSILDRYSVSCPEATYTIHIDRYICPMP